jgi:hypothetical protein
MGRGRRSGAPGTVQAARRGMITFADCRHDPTSEECRHTLHGPGQAGWMGVPGGAVIPNAI